MRFIFKWIPFILLFSVIAPDLLSQVNNQNFIEEVQDDQMLDANNPLVKLPFAAFHNYYIPQLYESPDESANQFLVRGTFPVGQWLLKGTLPVNTYPTSPVNKESGLGDLELYGIYLINDPREKLQIGLGPYIVVPTATDRVLGAGKFQIGVSGSVFNSRSNSFQYGGELKWQISIFGNQSRPGTNAIILQPLFIFQLGKGVYLRESPFWVFHFSQGNYNFPIGLGIGKVLKIGDKVMNLFAEPQYALFNKGAGLPEVQLFFGINCQFY